MLLLASTGTRGMNLIFRGPVKFRCHPELRFSVSANGVYTRKYSVDVSLDRPNRSTAQILAFLLGTPGTNSYTSSVVIPNVNR
jgi:hypothetical protein